MTSRPALFQKLVVYWLFVNVYQSKDFGIINGSGIQSKPQYIHRVVAR